MWVRYPRTAVLLLVRAAGELVAVIRNPARDFGVSARGHRTVRRHRAHRIWHQGDFGALAGGTPMLGGPDLVGHCAGMPLSDLGERVASAPPLSRHRRAHDL